MKSPFAIPDVAAHRGDRYSRRRTIWRSGPQRYYPRHASIETHAAKLLPMMFDNALLEVGASYALRAEELAETVKLNADNWQWHTIRGTAEGRGLYELYAWRFDVPVETAAIEILNILFSEAIEESRRD